MSARVSGRRLGSVIAVVLAITAANASAHVVFSRSSLRQWLQHSAVSVHAEILAGPEMWVAPGGRDRQEFFRARVLERLAGADIGLGEIVFFPHAEGFPGFFPGQRVLLFLERSDARAEFAGLTSALPWFSVQGVGEEWALENSGDPALPLARDLAAWLAAGGSDLDRFGVLLARGLGSGNKTLQADALRELMRARKLPGFLDRSGTARFAPFVSNPALGVARRAALLLLLAGRPGFDGGAAFTGLVDAAASARERRTLVNQLGAAKLEPVAAWLERLSTDPDASVRRAVVEVQLRRSTVNLALVERALADDSDAVARAAIRVLGGISDPRARALLEATAAGAEPKRARWSAAELRRAAP